MIVVDKGIAAFKLSIEQILRPMVNALSLDLGLRRTFRWVFVIADVNQPILGADFLRHFGLAVDVHNGKLLVTTTKLQVNGIISSSRPPPPPVAPAIVLPIPTDTCYSRLLCFTSHYNHRSSSVCTHSSTLSGTGSRFKAGDDRSASPNFLK